MAQSWLLCSVRSYEKSRRGKELVRCEALSWCEQDRELLADSVLKAAWVNCRAPLLARYDMVDSTPLEWIHAYEDGAEIASHVCFGLI